MLSSTAENQDDVSFPLVDDCDDRGVGSSVWKVYANTGAGFATDPTYVGLPVDPYDDWAQQSDLIGYSTTPCSTDAFEWMVMDLDGDGEKDLVLVDDCDDGGVGTEVWRYFPGSCAP